MSAAERVIRPASSDDVDASARIWDAGWRDAHQGRVPPELYRFRTPDTYPPRVRERLASTWVATLGGSVAGFVVVVDDEIEQLYVSGDARGTGTGVALLRRGEQVIADSGHERAWLAVATGNVEARGFYERVGWQDAGETEYAAEAGESTVSVPCRRLERVVGADRGCAGPR